MSLAVSQAHVVPTKHRDLIVRLADCESLALCVNTLALVDVVNTISEPHAAVALVSFDGVDCFSCVRGLDAFGCNLPARFVSDTLSIFQRQPVIVLKVLNGADVNHFGISFSFLFLIVV